MGWVLIARFDLLWIGLLALLNVALLLFWMQIHPRRRHKRPT
ncbi:MAG: hypothetical protein R2932_59410 [Caldilineaceae bacterium]